MVQGSSSAMLVLLGTVAVLLLSCKGATAETFTVGDSENWTLAPTNQIDFYTNSWAAKYTFQVGDVLQFVYTSAHNVLKMHDDSCDLSQGNGAPFVDGNTSIPLTSSGKKYYICAVPSHCGLGMKLEINVLANDSPTASPGPQDSGNDNAAAVPRLAGVFGFGTVAAVVLSAASFFL